MWEELVTQKKEWIGGELIDYGDSMDRRIASEGQIPARTVITDIVLTDTMFEVIGKDFTCSGNRQHLGVTTHPQFELEKGGLAFDGYGGHEWHIVKVKVK